MVWRCDYWWFGDVIIGTRVMLYCKESGWVRRYFVWYMLPFHRREVYRHTEISDVLFLR